MRFSKIVGIVVGMIFAITIPRFGFGAETSTGFLVVGAASEEITPDVPVMMGGFASRTEPHSGVRSPIFTRILYVSLGDTKLLWSQSDLIGFASDDVAVIQQLLAEVSGVPPQHVIVSATHTHSGPALASICAPKESAYFNEYLLPRMVAATRRAVGTREPCAMTVVEGYSALTHDRRNAPAPGDGAAPNFDPAKAVVDTRVPAVAFFRPDGSMKALLIQYAMHPTAWCDRLIGAEWPGAVADAVHATFGESVEPFILQGAAGNLGSPRRSPPPEEMQRWGDELVEAVAEKIRTSNPLTQARFGVETELLSVEYARFTAEEIKSQGAQYREQWAGRPDIIQNVVEPWEKNLLDHLEHGTGFTESVSVAAVAFGDHLFVTTPFETFAHLNNFLVAKVPFPVHVVAYTNGVFNYFPSADAYEQGGYEPNAYLWYLRFPLKSGGLEKLADDLVPLLQRVAKASEPVPE